MLFIKAAPVQSSFKEISKGGRPNLLTALFGFSNQPLKTTGEFGDFSQSIFDQGRRFKVRIKSKHSQKKVDLNLSFLQDIDSNFHREATNLGVGPTVPNFNDPNTLLAANLDYVDINSMYGGLYQSLMTQLAGTTTTGELVDREATQVSERRRDMSTPSGGGSNSY